MTEIEKLEFYADGCLYMAYFLAGFASCMVLTAGNPVVGFIVCVIGFALILSRRYIRKKIEMESTGGDGE